MLHKKILAAAALGVMTIAGLAPAALADRDDHGRGGWDRRGEVRRFDRDDRRFDRDDFRRFDYGFYGGPPVVVGPAYPYGYYPYYYPPHDEFDLRVGRFGLRIR